MPNAFVPKKHEPQLNNTKWDKYYYDCELKAKAKKTGPGEDDFVIVNEVVTTKRSIKEVIDSQADDVGLENILRKYALTGDESILPQNCVDDGQIIDFSGMPQDLIDAGNFYALQKAKFEALPDDIKKGRSFADFMANFTQAEFDAYVASLVPKTTPKDGE